MKQPIVAKKWGAVPEDFPRQYKSAEDRFAPVAHPEIHLRWVHPAKKPYWASKGFRPVKRGMGLIENEQAYAVTADGVIRNGIMELWAEHIDNWEARVQEQRVINQGGLHAKEAEGQVQEEIDRFNTERGGEDPQVAMVDLGSSQSITTVDGEIVTPEQLQTPVSGGSGRRGQKSAAPEQGAVADVAGEIFSE